MPFENGMAWSPNTDHLAIADDKGELSIWLVAEAKKTASISADRKRVFKQAWSPDGRHLAFSGFDGDVKIWSVASPDQPRVFKWPQRTAWTGGLSWSPDGTRLVSGGWDQIIRVWDVARGVEVLSLIGHSGAVRSLCWSPDGRRIASAGFDGNVKLWDAVTGIEILTLEAFTGEVRLVRWSPDGKWLAAIGAGGLKLWNASQDNDVARRLIQQNELLAAARTGQRNEPNNDE
jgi:WD40 repeat protein